MSKYLIPDTQKFGSSTKSSKTKPLFDCRECRAGNWCKYAPWVDGCNDDMGKVLKDRENTV